MGDVSSLTYTENMVTSIFVFFDDQSVGNIVSFNGRHDAIEIKHIDHVFTIKGIDFMRMAFDNIVIDTGHTIF